jgi:hypothetical protein
MEFPTICSGRSNVSCSQGEQDLELCQNLFEAKNENQRWP